MKKIIALLSALMLLVSMTACFAEEEAVGLANPWTETTEEGMLETIGLGFAIPENAENVTFRVLESEGMGEMTFTLDGMEFTARIQAADDFTDISGMYYEWEVINQEELEMMGRPAWEARATEDGETIDLCMWFDVVPGVMYSLSTRAADLDGFDIMAVAEMVFAPMQEDA